MTGNKNRYKALFIPAITLASLLNGIISGIMSVITVYFFKPLWEKIVIKILDAKQNYWNEKQ